MARRVSLAAIVIVIIGAAWVSLVWRRAALERRPATGQAAVERLQYAADAGRGAMLQEITRIHETLREVADASRDIRLATLAALAGNDAERTAMLLEGQRVTLLPARVLRYVPEPPAGDPLVEHRAGALLRAARTDVMRKQYARALAAYDELAQMHDVRIQRDPAPLIARCERLPLLPRPSRPAEAASILRDLESGTWALSRSTYESIRDELDDFIAAPRDVPLWEEAVHAVSAASRATTGQGGEVVIWADETRPVLLMWRSGREGAIALAVTGRHVADRWLGAERGFGYGIETAARQAFLPRPPGAPHTERILSFAGHEWRMITVAGQPDR